MSRPWRHSPWLILAVLCIAVLIVVIDNTIVNVALPTLSAKLNASDSGLQWIVDSYSLPFAGLLLAGGELSDRWGRRRVMQLSLVAFAGFSLMAAESHSMTQLLIARALMGVSAAFTFPATLSLITAAFDDLADPMLDIRLFRRGAFTSAAAAIATSFFCLFGFVFLVTQYFQLVHGYSPLSAGVHTLPFAIVTMIATPIGAVVALRIGIRWVVSSGLVIMGGATMWMAQFGARAVYWGPVVISMMALAVGFSFISSPSTSALMGSLTAAQIGAGAAVNETTRELGGTLGVAVVGSVFSSLFGRRIAEVLAPLGLSHHNVVVAQSSMQAALHVAALAGAGAPGAATKDGINQAFMDGFHRGCIVAAVTAIVVGVVTFFFLPRQSATPGHTTHPLSHPQSV